MEPPTKVVFGSGVSATWTLVASCVASETVMVYRIVSPGSALPSASTSLKITPAFVAVTTGGGGGGDPPSPKRGAEAPRISARPTAVSAIHEAVERTVEVRDSAVTEKQMTTMRARRRADVERDGFMIF